MNPTERLQQRLNRERLARKQAEQLLEEKSRQLYEVNQRLKAANEELETRVQKRTSQLRETVELAEAANQTKSLFLANMSHEIRTPLTAILGYASLLLDSKTSNTDFAQSIYKNGEHLLVLLNDILDLSKIEAGKIQIERIPTEMWQVVTNVARLMKVHASDKEIGFRIVCEGEIPKTICTDPNRLTQILVNLVGNAIKFTAEGEVRLTVKLFDHQGRPQMQLAVTDTGIGLSQEQIGKLFRPFEQADASTTREYGGTGLGLTISKQLSLMLGGDVHVVSELGKGSTFSVTIDTGPLDGVPMIDPLQLASRQVSDHQLPSTDRHSLNFHILLAEDTVDSQRLISHILKKAGAQVTIAENGKMAVELALAHANRDEPFDIILMDMMMPVLDGLEAVGQLRSNSYDGPIIALTADAMTGAKGKYLAGGCNDYATKPIDRTELIEKIRKLVKDSSRAA